MPDFRFLGSYVSEDLTWNTNFTSVLKRAEQSLNFLMIFRKNKRRAELSAELVLSHGVSLWFSSREEAAPEGQKLRPQTDWMPSSVSGGDQQDLLPPESPQHHHGPLAPRTPPLPAPREALQDHKVKNKLYLFIYLFLTPQLFCVSLILKVKLVLSTHYGHTPFYLHKDFAPTQLTPQS